MDRTSEPTTGEVAEVVTGEVAGEVAGGVVRPQKRRLTDIGAA